MVDPSFMLDAKCKRMDPALFDSGHPAEAALLCAGCPVIPECAEWFSRPIDPTGLMLEITGRVAGDVELVWASGVKAAGVDLG